MRHFDPVTDGLGLVGYKVIKHTTSQNAIYETVVSVHQKRRATVENGAEGGKTRTGILTHVDGDEERMCLYPKKFRSF